MFSVCVLPLLGLAVDLLICVVGCLCCWFGLLVFGDFVYWFACCFGGC